MIRRFTSITACTLALTALTSCGSLGGLSLGTSREVSAFITETDRRSDRSFTASGRLTLDYGDADQITVPVRYTLGGSLGVALSVRPLGIMEALRITVTDKEMLVIDRLNKRYMRAELGSISTKLASSLLGFNPHAVKAMLSNEPFSEKNYGPRSLSKLTFSDRRQETGGTYLFYDEKPRLELTFDEGKNLVRSYYEPAINTGLLAEYDAFVPVPGLVYTFPSLISYSLEMGIDDYRFDLRLDELLPYSGQEITTVPPAGYSELSISDMRQILGFLSKILF